jgi:hypothetical protein
LAPQIAAEENEMLRADTNNGEVFVEFYKAFFET